MTTTEDDDVRKPDQVAVPIPNVYHLESLGQLKALAEPIRYRMILSLKKPMTSARLARELGISRPKAHYHLRQLESAGLVRFHGEGMSHGITEKYFVVVGRMFDFTRLMPIKDELIPNDLTLATYGAIAAFLATMLEVSREHTLQTPDALHKGGGVYFDFESVLTVEQADRLKGKLRKLRREVLEMSREAEAMTEKRSDLVPFHLTTYLSPLASNEPDGGDE